MLKKVMPSPMSTDLMEEYLEQEGRRALTFQRMRHEVRRCAC